MNTLVSFELDGSKRRTEVKDNETLLDLLRERLRKRSVKAACWRGECGLCTVLIDGRPVKSCLVLAREADGTKIQTAQGLMRDGKLSPLQEAFVRHGALQCGFCTPAFVVASHYLISSNPGKLTEEQVKEGVSGLICRCGCYKQIVSAVLEASTAHSSP